MLHLSILTDDRLLQRTALGGEENDFGLRSAKIPERSGDGGDLHHHTGASPVGSVIDGAVSVACPSAQIDRLKLHEPRLLGAAKDALLENTFGNAGNGGQNLDLKHGGFDYVSGG